MSNLPPKYNIFASLNVNDFAKSYISAKSIDDCFDRYIDYYSKNQQFTELKTYLSKIVMIPYNKNKAGFLLNMEIEFKNMLTRDFLLFSANTLELFIKKHMISFISLKYTFCTDTVGEFMNDLEKCVKPKDIALKLGLHENDINIYKNSTRTLRQTRNNIMHEDYLATPQLKKNNQYINFAYKDILEYFVKSMIYLQCVIKYVECKDNIKFQ